jgi:integrase
MTFVLCHSFLFRYMLLSVREQTKKKRRTRGTGSLCKIKGSPFWYLFYKNGSKTVRESSKSESKMVAEALLARRIGEAGLGIRPAQELKKYSYEDARSSLLKDYEERGLKSLVTRADGKKTICGLVQLDEFYAGRSLASISTDDVREFIRQRQGGEAGNAIINRSNALLRRMLNLAHERDGKLREVPYIPMLKEPDPREGFLEPQKFDELCAVMPENLQPILLYLYRTGCRTGAAKKIDWSQVSFNGKRVEILLRAGQVKNKRPLLLPLPDKIADALRAVPFKKRTGLVFDATNLTKAFRKACVAVGLGRWRDPKNHDAGYDGLVLHDFRRSGVRNLRRAKVAEDVAMKISGHRTTSVFKRYNIVDSDDLHDAMQSVSAFVKSKAATS